MCGRVAIDECDPVLEIERHFSSERCPSHWKGYVYSYRTSLLRAFSEETNKCIRKDVMHVLAINTYRGIEI
jgi:hypothetical protein